MADYFLVFVSECDTKNDEKKKLSFLRFIFRLRSEIQNLKKATRLNLILILNWPSIYCDHSQDGSTPAVVNEIG